MIKITFPDGNIKEFEKGITIEEIAQSISPGLKKSSLAGKVNGELYDFNRPINNDAKIQIVTKKDKESYDILNHSAAHLLAQAVKRLFPNATFGIGPSIDEGFYYDIDTNAEPLTEADLPKLEKEMQKITSSGISMERTEVSKEEALELFRGDMYKKELINELPKGETISVYTQGEFKDLCRGGHVGHTKSIKFFKLLSIAGAYWRGDSNNVQLQRVYGTAWHTKDELTNHLKVLEERKERDHRRLNKSLNIFDIQPEFGQGLALWLPKGYAVRKQLEDYVYKLERKAGYQHVSTPVLASKKLYETSGHWNHYRDNMFPVMERDGEELVLRPMSCPHHMLVYKTELRSYRDLPIRYAELVTQHRYEASGALTGLERVRAMTLTDSHIFCMIDQVKQEVKDAFNLVKTAINDLGLTIDYVELALRDKEKGKYHDDDQLWEKSQNMLRELLDEMGVEYTEMEGEAAFYGPKIDIQVRTAMNHVITMSTVQLDFLLPERFDLTYVAAGGAKERPVVIHRGLISTWERLMSILMEQYKGAFPTWLAPEQVKIIPVSNEAHYDYCKDLFDKLIDEDIRVSIDDREEKLGYKIREAQTQKIPYQLVIGDKEKDSNQVNIRRFGSEEQTSISIKDFVKLIKQDIKNKDNANK